VKCLPLFGGTEENHEGIRIVIWDLVLNDDCCETVVPTLQYSMLGLERQTLCLLGGKKQALELGVQGIEPVASHQLI